MTQIESMSNHLWLAHSPLSARVLGSSPLCRWIFHVLPNNVLCSLCSVDCNTLVALWGGGVWGARSSMGDGVGDMVKKPGHRSSLCAI